MNCVDIVKAVVLAAGKGTRMQPITEIVPKPLLPIAGKPILEWTVNLLKSNLDIQEIIMVVGYKADSIKKYFGNGNKFDVRIKYIEQDLEKNPGLAAAVKLTESEITDDFVLILGDNFYYGSFKEILEFHSQTAAGATLHVEHSKEPQRYGVVITDENEQTIVKQLIEKPQNPPSNLVSTGFYVLKPEIFSAIENIKPSKRGEYEITDAINDLGKHYPIRAKLIDSWRKDIGFPKDLLDTNNWVLKNLENGMQSMVGHNNTQYLPPLTIGENCEIHNSIIGPYVSIGDNTLLQDCNIRNSIVLSNTKLTNFDAEGCILYGNNLIKVV